MGNPREHSDSCHKILGSLGDYIDGELDPDLCAELERHMDGCENCRIVVDSIRKTIYLYRTVNPCPEVPGEVRERLFQTLDLEEFSKKEK